MYKAKPTEEKIINFVNDFNKKSFTKIEKENYNAAIILVKKFPSNQDYKSIYIKVNFINGAFKTRIGDTLGVAKNIYRRKKAITNGLEKDDLNIVSKIGLHKSKLKKERFFYSFATKYCHCHKPKNYPIYDSYVAHSLIQFKKIYKFTKLSHTDIKNYKKFIKMLDDFKQEFKLENVDYSKLDRYLWKLGKDDKGKK